MSETIASQRSQYPLAAYNFRVTVDGKDMGFAEVSGLVREYQTLTYRHGLSFWEGERITKFRSDTYSEVTLKKGVFVGATQTSDNTTSVNDTVTEIYRWLDSVDKKTLSVGLCDENGVAVVRWSIQKAIVIKLEAPSLQAGGNEAAIDTLTLMASGISVEHS